MHCRWRSLPAFFILSCIPLMLTQRPPGGTVTVSPAEGVAGEYGTWTVTYRTGEGGVRQGGGVRVQLPDTWHAGDRNSANRLQATNPAAPHYISARSSRSAIRLKTTVESEAPPEEVLVKNARPGLDGRRERYIYVVRVKLLEGSLETGDALSVIYGDRSGGGAGMRAAIVSTGPEAILLAVDALGNGNHQLLADRPTLSSRPGPAAEILLAGPSTLVVHRAAELHLAVLDKNKNPADSFRGKVRLTLSQGRTDLPEEVVFDGGRGWRSVRFVPRETGLIRLSAVATPGDLRVSSNPMSVSASEPPLKLFWGDLHSHTRYSWDGVGDGSFDYARFVSGLDFYAVSDHSSSSNSSFTEGLGPQVWDEYTQQTEKYNDPGRFATLHAYEASFGTPYGHHNVYFRSAPGPLLAPGKVTLPELWRALTAGEALTIPHHTGKFPAGVRWEPDDPAFRRNFEIYSAHGLSEAYDPSHPLAFEQSDFTAPSRSARGGGFAQDAWMRGLMLSSIASSDDHRAQPGQPHWGIVAVRAPALHRAEIFDALHRRRTYATTGARILLDFSVNGVPMGGEVSSNLPPTLKIEANGTAPIEKIEILRYTKGDAAFTTIHAFEPHRLDFTWSGKDETVRGDSIYYVRLRQEGMVRNRIAMAWSSPVWMRKGGS